MNYGEKASSGLKKIYRKDPVKKSVLRTPLDLTGAIFVFGKIGSGKTVTLLTLSGIYHDNPARRYKIFDAWGGERNENLYWGLPSNKNRYWNYLKKALRLDEEGAKQYKVEYIYPMNPKLRQKLPFNPPNVTSKIITFDINDIKAEDFSLVVGSISESSIGLWNEVIMDAKKGASAYEIAHLYRKRVSKTNILFNAAINPMVKKLLIQNKKSIFNYGQKQISKMLDDQETITVLCMDGLDVEFQLFVVGYIIRKIKEEIDRRRRKVIINMREVSEFFKVNDFSIVPERFKVMKRMLSNWIRYGRRGMHFILDVQSIADVRGIVGGQQDLTFLGRLPDQRDREEATRQLIRDGLIKDRHVKVLGTNSPGQFIVCPGGKQTQYNYMLLPRCRFWETSNGNFYNNVWKKEVGRWINFDEERDQMKEKYFEDVKEYEIRNKKVDKRRKIKEEVEEEDDNEVEIETPIIEDKRPSSIYDFIEEKEV